MPREFLVIGPPGAGKTTYLSAQVKHAAASYGINKVAVCSLTRSAASHVLGKVEIPRENVGTIHGFAYRALPGVEIAEVKSDLFNEWCAENKHPAMKVGTSGRKVDPDREDIVEVPTIGETVGDKLQNEMNRHRARMVKREAWPDSVKAFASLWEMWKKDAGLLDFTDLLEIAFRNVAECPGKPGALFVDESQDCSRLAFSLVRKWGERCLRFITVGDADQCLYEWSGVDVRAFYESNLPVEQTRLLHQSYRVPAEVHALAVRWINETPGRKPIVYEPRRVNPNDPASPYVVGKVSRCAATIAAPRLAVEDAKRRAGDGKTCLFLVSCSYMLTKIIAELRDAGVPYHNPYRQKRGDWNPLRIGGASPATRVASFVKLDPFGTGVGGAPWTNKDVARWSEWLPTADYLVYGARTAIDEAAKELPDETPNIVNVLDYFKTGHWDSIVNADLDWWTNAIDRKQRDKLAYPLSVLRANGYAALTVAPKVIVSTIHAAKGGEADAVFLFPDLSPQAYTAWMGRGEGKEGVRRAYYVALTRAREELILCGAATNMAIRI